MMTSPRPDCYENNSSVFSVYSVGSIFMVGKKQMHQHKTENSVTIGHLDTGVCCQHPALSGKVRKFIALDKNGNAAESDQGYDTAFHGTHTAGIICHNYYNGLKVSTVDPELNVVSVPERGKTLLNLLTGMDLLLDCNINIACMPIGVLKKTPVFLGLIEAFHKKGILVIAPIGNNGEGNVHSPGCYPGVLSVGAVDENGNVARFSGSYQDENGHCLKPDIMAPGVNILSAAPGNKTKKRSGTSMACAYVAGIAARLRQAKPGTSAEDIKNALLNTTRQLPPGQEHRCRTGIAHPEAALDYLLDSLPPAALPGAKLLKKFDQNFLLEFSIKQPYIDPRLRSQYQRAKPDEKIESVIAPKKLIPEVKKKIKAAPEITRYFKNADMAYIRAERLFYDELLNHGDLFLCSAVDISIFEM